MSLIDKTIGASLIDILQMNNSNNGIDTTARYLVDGEGTQSALKISDDVVSVRPNNDNTTGSFNVVSTSGTSILAVDTTNELVKASGNTVNTQYSQFNIGSTESTQFADDTHQAIPFESANYSLVSVPPAFGTGTDPATTFTTEDTNGLRGCDIVPCLWYIQDNISIDSVISLEGADADASDTTRMHLMSYDFTANSASILSSGTLLAYSADITNAGATKGYSSTWTIDSASVTAGKVVVATFESDSVYSDYSINLVVKYHLS